jgi:hypothetical protein
MLNQIESGRIKRIPFRAEIVNIKIRGSHIVIGETGANSLINCKQAITKK